MWHDRDLIGAGTSMLPGPQSRRRNGCLTAALRSNLIEIAQTKRFRDAEALLDVLLDRLIDRNAHEAEPYAARLRSLVVDRYPDQAASA